MYVLNTRPCDSFQPLSEALADAGMPCVHLPLLDIEPMAVDAEMMQKLQAIPQMNAIVVLSPRAAELGLAYVQSSRVRLADDLQWFAIGTSTARVLQQAGFTVTTPPLETSEGALQLAELTGMAAGTQVMIWRGRGGRQVLARHLENQGVILTEVVWYERRQPSQLAARWHALLSRDGWPDRVLISSGESWQQWRELTQHDSIRPELWVLGERVSEQIRGEAHALHWGTPHIRTVNRLNPAYLLELGLAVPPCASMTGGVHHPSSSAGLIGQTQ